jgi:hypothetical protein
VTHAQVLVASAQFLDLITLLAGVFLLLS